MTCVSEEVPAAVREPLAGPTRGTLPLTVDAPPILPAARRLRATWRWSTWSRLSVSVGTSLAGHVGVLAWLAVAPLTMAPQGFPVQPGKASVELQASLASPRLEQPAEDVEIEPARPEPWRRAPAHTQEPGPMPDAVAEGAVAKRIPELPARVPRQEPIPPTRNDAKLAHPASETRRTEAPPLKATTAFEVPKVPKASPAPAALVEAAAQSARAARPSAASEASAGAVGSAPATVFNPAPTYPPEALAARRTGRVVLRVEVGPEGMVVSAEVYRSSGSTSLDNAALEAVRRWRFSPAPGSLIREVAVPVRFTIADSFTSGD